jgi:Rrf2 family protein
VHILKISTKGRYGLKALIDIANISENEPVSITSIASRQKISERYLEQLMSKLKKAGIINSIRGANGGYILAKAPEDVSVGDILRALEGDLVLVDCLGASNEENCGFVDTCATKYVWQRISDSINQTVEDIKLNQLMNQ